MFPLSRPVKKEENKRGPGLGLGLGAAVVGCVFRKRPRGSCLPDAVKLSVLLNNERDERGG